MINIQPVYVADSVTFPTTVSFGFTGVFGDDFSETDRKIRSFGSFSPGWHYGRGVPAPQHVVGIARAYLMYFMMLGFTETDAFPGVDGEIMVTAYRGTHCIEVTVGVDRTFTVTHESNGEDRYHDSGLSGVKASAAIETATSNIAQEECATSSLSISNGTSIGVGANSQTWLSNHPTMGAGLLSFWNNAELTQAVLSAGTLMSTTQASAAFPPFSGGSMTLRSLLPAI